MSNKTFIPAFQCAVGDWKYYICMMKFAEVARQVQFAYELGSNEELGVLLQRGITERTKEITEYLLTSPHRFLGGLVIAAWGGEPTYTPLSMDDPAGMLKGIDREFGVLTFDGTQAYFVLDGQHRLKAIKEALKQNPDLGKDDISILIVTHYNHAEGRKRTRRLFSNINRNAKQTGYAENIALDEDDGYAILTRRMLDEHEFLRENGRVRVIQGNGGFGRLKLAQTGIPKGDKKALTSMTVLYDMLQYLGFDFLIAMANSRQLRPSDQVLDDSYKVLSSRVDDLMKYCGDVRSKLVAAISARDLRAPKDNEGAGHPFMRPAVQKAVAKVVSEIVKSDQLTWGETMVRLAQLDWTLASSPWQAVFSRDGAKMLVGKENTELLCALLRVHLAPQSIAQIKRARKDFKDVRGLQYEISEDTLAARLLDAPEKRLTEISLEREASEGPEFAVPAVGEDEDED
ncbi:MAG: DGQHR domain-containing protein [Acidimicrobiia bacterium]|nr:DGQHR domain-containing protein [Acidimicrobiia bacterium]